MHRAAASTWRASVGRPRRPKPLDQFLPRPGPVASAVHWRRADPKPNWIIGYALLPAVPPVDCAAVLCYAGAGTLCGSRSARDAVRHGARNSRSAPETLAASPNVRHRESLFCAPAAHDWTRLAPDGVCPTSGPHLPASHSLASSTAPALPKPVSSIARWIPLLLPRPAARGAIPPAVATARGCSHTSVAPMGIRLRLRHQPQPPPASFYGHRFPLSYTP